MNGHEVQAANSNSNWLFVCLLHACMLWLFVHGRQVLSLTWRVTYR